LITTIARTIAVKVLNPVFSILLSLSECCKEQEKSTVLKKVTGTKAKFKVDQKATSLFGHADYYPLRKKTIPYQEDDVEMAWTQPVVY
jgi:hypothetical protein